MFQFQNWKFIPPSTIIGISISSQHLCSWFISYIIYTWFLHDIAWTFELDNSNMIRNNCMKYSTSGAVIYTTSKYAQFIESIYPKSCPSSICVTNQSRKITFFSQKLRYETSRNIRHIHIQICDNEAKECVRTHGTNFSPRGSSFCITGYSIKIIVTINFS